METPPLPCPFQSLPKEVLQTIASLLDAISLCTWLRTDKCLYGLIADSAIWENQLVATWSEHWRNMISLEELATIQSNCKAETKPDLHRQIFIYLNTLPQRVSRCDKVSKRHTEVVSIVTLGEFGVGKTSLLHRLINGEYHEDFAPTIENDYVIASYEMDPTTEKSARPEKVECRLYDSAGQERFQTVDSRWQYPRIIHAIIVAYSVADRRSFEKLHSWATLASSRAEPLARYVLVACKCDLPEGQWEVSSYEGRAAAAALGWRFIETSAKANLHVEQLFCHAVTFGLEASWEAKQQQSRWKKKVDVEPDPSDKKPHIGKRLSGWISSFFHQNK
eukprot:TRINITY_DN1203_c0_g1_i1.p1 TRINITY_DN1203_c0_g1~~TRINITY_DN1203_c0_g1_i1.p1  ORF type:complete len:334 (+),score=40.18 TRINITY_DN1203_c0_g1_i1:294-1295(+)